MLSVKFLSKKAPCYALGFYLERNPMLSVKICTQKDPHEKSQPLAKKSQPLSEKIKKISKKATRVKFLLKKVPMLRVNFLPIKAPFVNRKICTLKGPHVMRYIFTQKGPHMLSIRYFFGRG